MALWEAEESVKLYHEGEKLRESSRRLWFVADKGALELRDVGVGEELFGFWHFTRTRSAAGNGVQLAL